MKYLLLNLGIVIILCLLIFYRFKSTNKQTNELIKKQGWTLYLLDDCPHCNTQLQDLSLFKEYIIYNKDGEIVKNLKGEIVKNLKSKKITKNNIQNGIQNGIQNRIQNGIQNIIPFTQIKSFPLWYNTITNEKIYGVQDIKIISEKINN